MSHEIGTANEVARKANIEDLRAARNFLRQLPAFQATAELVIKMLDQTSRLSLMIDEYRKQKEAHEERCRARDLIERQTVELKAEADALEKRCRHLREVSKELEAECRQKFVRANFPDQPSGGNGDG